MMRRFIPGQYGKFLAVLVAIVLWVTIGDVAYASRFGPPWQIEVTAESTIVYEQPSSSSPVVGPLPRGAVTILLGEVQGPDDIKWVSTIDGYVPANDVAELDREWVAEVSAPSVSIYAKPDIKSGVRRTAQQGDLLRVTGAAAGLDGDRNIWWSTTEGYVHIRTLALATSEWARGWTLPSGSEAPSGWWGMITTTANVRAGATTASPILGRFGGGEYVKILAEEEGESISDNNRWYRIDGGRYAGARVHSSLISEVRPPQATTRGSSASKYIVVNRAARTLTLVENGQATFATFVAIGEAGADTPTGGYTTFGKFLADDMTSRSLPYARRSYDLPNVPFTQYYLDGGYAIHGTYWHDLFGTRQSQGCINLTWTDAAYLFQQTAPQVPEGQNHQWAGSQEATPVLILD